MNILASIQTTSEAVMTTGSSINIPAMIFLIGLVGAVIGISYYKDKNKKTIKKKIKQNKEKQTQAESIIENAREEKITHAPLINKPKKK